MPVEGRNEGDVDGHRSELVGDHLSLEQRRTLAASWRSRRPVHLQGKYSRTVFRSGTDLISLLILLFLLLLGVTVPLQKAHGAVVSNRIVVKFDKVVLEVNTRRLTDLDF